MRPGEIERCAAEQFAKLHGIILFREPVSRAIGKSGYQPTIPSKSVTSGTALIGLLRLHRGEQTLQRMRVPERVIIQNPQVRHRRSGQAERFFGGELEPGAAAEVRGRTT